MGIDLVQADASGVPEKIEVSGTLYGFSAEDGTYAKDASQLSELKNITGEEEWAAAEDGTVYWQNLGKEIHYEGVSDAALPVDLKVTYFLDGEELPLEKIKGKSGRVRIRLLQKEDAAYRGFTPSYTEQEVTASFLIETEGT